MKIYIVRHGKPEGTDSGKRYIGITDTTLSSAGKEQAEELGARIASEEAGSKTEIISSPLIRCFETARIIRGYVKGGPVRIEKDLREINMGIWDGKLFDEIRKEFPEEYEARGRNLWSYRVPGGETFEEAGSRFHSVVRNLIAEKAAEVTILVSHAGAVRAGLSLLTDIPFEKWTKRPFPYAGAFVLEIRGEAITEISDF